MTSKNQNQNKFNIEKTTPYDQNKVNGGKTLLSVSFAAVVIVRDV